MRLLNKKLRSKTTDFMNSKILIYVFVLLLLFSPIIGLISKTTLSFAGDANVDDSFKDYAGKNMERFINQTIWLDFSDTNAIKNMGPNDSFQVGTVFEKELSPGFVVRLEVTALKPFNATQIYKDRADALGVPDDVSNYSPTATNIKKFPIDEDPVPMDIIMVEQGGYSNSKNYGLDIPGKTTIASRENGGNVGIEFKVEAKLDGQVIPANILMLDGEECKADESIIMTTDGEPWELVAHLFNDQTEKTYEMATYETKARDNVGPMTDEGVLWFNTEETESTLRSKENFGDGNYKGKHGDLTVHDGLGTQVFGPVLTQMNKYSVPLVMSKNANNVGVYILTEGIQSAMIGFVIIDTGDAPESYGTAEHVISNNGKVSQPYLGTVQADANFKEGNDDKSPWTYDDDQTNADEGIDQLTGGGVDLTYNVDSPTYELKFKANPGENPEAFARGWVDFNNNGKFDDNEASDIVTINSEGDYVFSFKDISGVPKDVEKLGVRTRIAIDRVDIESPNIAAYSGEVEDFQIPVYREYTTNWVDEDGNVLAPPVTDEDTKEPGSIDGYTFVETKTDDDGNVTHVFKKNEYTTNWVDEDGNVLAPPVTDEDTKEPGSFDGYTLVESKKDADGNVTHVFKKNEYTTNWVDEDGNVLAPPVTDEDTKEPGSFDGYTFVETKTDDDGNVTHVFKKNEYTTNWVDEDGNVLAPPVTGKDTKAAGSIDGYTLVETKTDADGNVTHIFKKNVEALPETGTSGMNIQFYGILMVILGASLVLVNRESRTQ